MESLETTACFRDDLLDFPTDDDEDVDDVVLSSSSLKRRAFSLLPHAHTSPEFEEEEEELEWISNKDAFPMVESLVDIMPNHPSISNNNNGLNNSSSSHLSPVSVLENSSSSSSGISCTNFSFDFGNFSSSNSRCQNVAGGGSSGVPGLTLSAMVSLTGLFKVPGKARSKLLRRRRREMSGQQFQCWVKVKPINKAVGRLSSVVGRKCLHCGAEKTPQWRTGPCGPKTLCNACGVRYKSGRLVPEYRPASSPTFSSELHSNSHRKIVEMRRQKMVEGVLVPVVTQPEHVG